MTTKFVIYDGPQVTTETTTDHEGRMVITATLDTDIASCISNLKTLTGLLHHFNGDDYSCFTIHVQRSRFEQLFHKYQTIPDAVMKALLDQIDSVARGHRIVLVVFREQTPEVGFRDYPDDWHVPLLKELFRRQIFTWVEDKYLHLDAVYTQLHKKNPALTEEQVLALTTKRV